MDKIKIHTEFIKLNQLLKWSNVAESGADANRMIVDGMVKVNDSVETRRGKKIYPGDTVTVDGIAEFVVAREGSAEIVSEGDKP